MAPKSVSIGDSVQYVRGVGPRREETLERLGIRTVRDLLYCFPRKYHDRQNLVSIADAEPGTQVMICGDVVKVNLHRKGRGKGVLSVTVRDNTGEVRAVWFNQNYLAERFDAGDTVLMWGGIREYNGLEIVSPGFEHVGSEEHGGIALADEKGSHLIPVYPLTEGLSQGQLRPIIRAALDDFVAQAPEILPESLRKRYKLPAIGDALWHAHFPEKIEEKDEAKRRLIYEEFLVFQLAVALRRHAARSAEGIAFKTSTEFDRRIRKRFPFELTAAQERALAEIVADMRSPAPMNRLLQGDVGCGKTVVALYAMLLAAANKYQSAIMAPTGILAEQHYRTITGMLEGSKLKVRLLTGASERREVLAEIERGEVDIVIGTHAVIQSDVAFHRLGFVVVDEQHKFGVMQRATLRWKGHAPDVLVMTATPIPRTLALTLFGDLDVSTIDELPPGRVPVDTRRLSPGKLRDAHEFIRKQVDAGRQAYVVCPTIEQSETMDLRSAMDTADELNETVFPEFNVGLLHGRMAPDQKERAMAAFVRGDMQIMVSTVVIEVGVDVPNSTVMLVLHAERFGLAQLHQLRGRIGRGADQAYCLLCSATRSEDAKRRLEVMIETTDGFRIAEEDLKIRGTGELFGTRQHGLPDVRIGDFTEDITTLERARDDAAELVVADPSLQRPEHAALRERMLALYHGRLGLIGIG
jgi:ATP-dependent DNA helicase RecG